MPELTESERFQVQEARDALARWDHGRGAPAVRGTERVLADHLRAVLSLIPGEDPSRCAVCRTPASDTELHFCPSHKRWECRDVSACVARIRQTDSGKVSGDD